MARGKKLTDGLRSPSCKRGFVGSFGFFAGRFAEALDKHLELTADKPRVFFFADLILQCEQLIIAAALDLFGNVVEQEFVGLGPGAGAVFENKAVLEPALADEADALLERLVGLPAEADNEIARHGAIGDDVADARHH